MQKNVVLTWTLPTVRQSGQALTREEIKAVRVERQIDGQLWTAVAVIDGTDPGAVLDTFTDTNVPNGTYRYRVNVIDTNDRVGAFVQINNIPVEDPPLPANPTAPTGFVGVSNNQDIIFNWNLPTLRQNGVALPSNQIGTFTIETSIDDGATWSVVVTAPRTTSYVWASVAYRTYKFRIRVTDNTNGLAGAFSDPITVVHAQPVLPPAAPTALGATVVYV